jgi:hypothetical protein
VKESYIADFIEIFTVGKTADSFPDIDSLNRKVSAPKISVPSFVKVVTFIDQYSPPVKNLQMIF